MPCDADVIPRLRHRVDCDTKKDTLIFNSIPFINFRKEKKNIYIYIKEIAPGKSRQKPVATKKHSESPYNHINETAHTDYKQST